YNHHIPQRSLGYLAPVQALKNWQNSHPHLFTKSVYNETKPDSYDIKSYEKDGKERFIEVKATTGETSQFQLTFNEYKVAKKYGKQYWIYFVHLDNNSTPKITMINDPIEKEKKGILLFRPSSFWVTITEEDA
ncbi:DUF3883 domain-containing protein, partial [Desulfovulcanus sp.]